MDWPARAHTMIGLKRLANVRACVEDVLANGVPGAHPTRAYLASWIARILSL